MSGKANKNQVRLYAFGNSYIMSSDFVKNEKLQIRFSESGSVCINRISSDEWESMCKGKSMNSSIVYTGLGCLGILSLPNELQQQQYGGQQQTSAANNDTLSYLVFVRDASSVGSVRTFDMMRINDLYILSLNDVGGNYNSYAYSQQNNSQQQGGVGGAPNYYSLNSLNEIKKLLCSGTFYFATSYDPNYSYDITLSCQARYLNQPTNKKFLWNYNMHIPFRRLNIDPNQWLIKIMCGYVEIRNANCEKRYIKAALFSRLSNERVGTRFQCRGVNDAGQCANFVETEQALFTTDLETNCEEEFSFIQLRGSVPVFFEQPGVQVGSHRIKISRSMEACYPAFERHLVSIIHDYGPNIYVLNLLGTKGDENELTGALRVLCENSPFYRKRQLNYFNFDYHNEMKINKGAKSKVWQKLTSSGFYDESFNGAFFYTRIPPSSGGSSNGADNDSGFDSSSMGGAFSPPQNRQPSPEQQSVTQLQRNFVRTNCMDCLDRTNSVQSYLAAEEMVWHQLKNLVRESEYRRFRDIFLSMWVLSGDHISKIYAGTGAIQGRSVTQDFTRSLGRALQNNLFDDNKNDSIEMYLNAPHSSSLRRYGELEDVVYNLTSKAFLRLPFTIVRELIYKKREFIDVHKCRLVVGTWNVNGGFSDGDMKRVNLAEWLLDGPVNAKRNGLGYLDTWLREANLNTTDLGEVDMFVIGFEEIVDLSAQNIINASEENATIWRRKITEFLSKYGDYVEVIYENLQLVGVCLFVFVLRKHVAAIRDVSVAKTKTGLGGAAGNKGGVLLRFVYYNTSLCFVCAHFAAHQKQVKERNDDFRQIYEQSQFVGGSRLKLTPRNHDYVFWCGDLNYRIDMANDRCRSLIGERSWPELLELDQLTVQRKEKNVFKEFYEAPISFPPTYKYNILEDTYDRSEKCRVPAWTDRILWRKRPDVVDKKADVGRCLYYGRADIRYSDHRPVSGLFEIETDKVDPSRLVDTLHKSFQSTHGSFQVVLVVTTQPNCMNEVVRNAIVKLFACFPSYCFAREYRGAVYVVFSDGKNAYEALAQLNNYNLESFDLLLQIRVENEASFAFLFEEEIRDCLNSLSYYDNNLRKLAMSSITAPTEVKVADLLGDDTYTSEAFLNVPSQLHTDLSHVARLSSSSPSEFSESSAAFGSSLGEPKNPLVKALSNSNLASMFDAPLSTSLAHQQHKFVHSEANLLDLSASQAGASGEGAHHHLLHQHSNQGHRPPPKRPPPPTAAQLAVKEDKLIDISGDEADESKKSAVDEFQIFEQQVSNDSSGAVSFGFEDDFSKMMSHDLAFSVPSPPQQQQQHSSIPRPPSIQIANQQQQHQPSPPPIPPLPPVVATAASNNRAAPFVPVRPVPTPPQPPALPSQPPAVTTPPGVANPSSQTVKPNLLFQLLDDSGTYETTTPLRSTPPPAQQSQPPPLPPPPAPPKPSHIAGQQPTRPPPLPPMPSVRPRPPTPPSSSNQALLEELFDSSSSTARPGNNAPPPLPPPPSNMPRIPPRPQQHIDPFAPMTTTTHPQQPPPIPPHPKAKQPSPFDSDFDPFAPLPPPRENHFK